MRYRLTSAVIGAAVGLWASSATAGDWTGPYVGAHAGGGFGDFDWWFRPLPGASPNNRADHDGVGLIGGIQAGYDWQIDNWVLGVNAEIEAGHIKGSDRCPGREWSCESDVQWLGSVKGRLGFAVSDLLLYGTAGVGVSRLEALTQNGIDSSELDKNHVGWVAGLGAEYRISADWALKAEALHYDFAEKAYQAPGSDIIVDTGSRLNTISIGVNRRF